MTNNHNLSAAEIAAIEALTHEELAAIADRMAPPYRDDDEIREALAQAVADGYSIGDFSGD